MISASESAAAAAALTVGGEVVATEMAEGDVFESESPVRDAGTVCGRGVGADRPADGEDVGVEVDVGDAVHSVRSDLTHVSAEVRVIGEEAVVRAKSLCGGELIRSADHGDAYFAVVGFRVGHLADDKCRARSWSSCSASWCVSRPSCGTLWTLACAPPTI